MDQYQVIINHKYEDSISPRLLKSLESQSLPHQILKIQSSQYPSRLSHVQDDKTLYFFFDEDVELPHKNYLQDLTQIFQSSPDMLFLAGAYLNSENTGYLAGCYNSCVTLWMMITKQNDVSTCENAPGGAWVVSGKMTSLLSDWKEPNFWAGEDTYSLRWLQKKGVTLYHSPKANVLHHPQSRFSHFARRAFRQGRARTRENLQSPRRNLDWNFCLHHILYWPGWLLHQLLVELGALYSFILSVIARITP